MIIDSLIWSHLQQSLRVDQTCYLVLSIVVSTALDCCQLLLSATASQLGGSPSHSWPESSPCFRLVLISVLLCFLDCTINFRLLSQPLFSFVMVFTVTDLGGVFSSSHSWPFQRCVLWSVLLPSTCSSRLVSLRPSTVYATLPLKSRLVPYSSGSDFAFVFGSSILQACSCPFRAFLQLTFRAHVLYCCFSATPFSVVTA